MNARRQRLNELIAARDRIDAQIARLDPTTPLCPPTWLVSAHQTLLLMPSHGYVTHPRTRKAAA